MLPLCRFIGPLPSGMVQYKGHFMGTLATSQWDLRPLGFLPLRTLSVSVTGCEARHNRELCFQILQVGSYFVILRIIGY